MKQGHYIVRGSGHAYLGFFCPIIEMHTPLESIPGNWNWWLQNQWVYGKTVILNLDIYDCAYSKIESENLLEFYKAIL